MAVVTDAEKFDKVKGIVIKEQNKSRLEQMYAVVTEYYNKTPSLYVVDVLFAFVSKGVHVDDIKNLLMQSGRVEVYYTLLTNNIFPLTEKERLSLKAAIISNTNNIPAILKLNDATLCYDFIKNCDENRIKLDVASITNLMDVIIKLKRVDLLTKLYDLPICDKKDIKTQLIYAISSNDLLMDSDNIDAVIKFLESNRNLSNKDIDKLVSKTIEISGLLIEDTDKLTKLASFCDNTNVDKQVRKSIKKHYKEIVNSITKNFCDMYDSTKEKIAKDIINKVLTDILKFLNLPNTDMKEFLLSINNYIDEQKDYLLKEIEILGLTNKTFGDDKNNDDTISKYNEQLKKLESTSSKTLLEILAMSINSKEFATKLKPYMEYIIDELCNFIPAQREYNINLLLSNNGFKQLWNGNLKILEAIVNDSNVENFILYMENNKGIKASGVVKPETIEEFSGIINRLPASADKVNLKFRFSKLYPKQVLVEDITKETFDRYLKDERLEVYEVEGEKYCNMDYVDATICQLSKDELFSKGKKLTEQERLTYLKMVNENFRTAFINGGCSYKYAKMLSFMAQKGVDVAENSALVANAGQNDKKYDRYLFDANLNFIGLPIDTRFGKGIIKSTPHIKALCTMIENIEYAHSMGLDKLNDKVVKKLSSTNQTELYKVLYTLAKKEKEDCTSEHLVITNLNRLLSESKPDPEICLMFAEFGIRLDDIENCILKDWDAVSTDERMKIKVLAKFPNIEKKAKKSTSAKKNPEQPRLISKGKRKKKVTGVTADEDKQSTDDNVDNPDDNDTVGV